MDILFICLASFVLTACVYLLAVRMIGFLAEKELEKSEDVITKGNDTEIFAKPESLEFYLRCASAACGKSDGHIIVYLDRNDPKLGEELYIIGNMQLKYPNIIYKYK